MTIEILIADDHELIRQGLRSVFEQQHGWNLCAEAGDGRQAVELATKLKPDLVILDISMPELNGLEAARQIRRALPQVEVLILTMHESEQLVLDIVAAGARGYLLKSDAARLLVVAVEALASHQPFFTGKVSEMILRSHAAQSSAGCQSPPGAMTPREREIIQLLAEGKSNKQIAIALGISPKTVEVHRSNLMRKFHLHSVTDLVRYAVRNKIIEA
jgi:DNA-binding NarL/FixJ family response regulator